MDAASIILGVVSSLCSILSTAYDIEKLRRDTITIRTAYERLKDGVESNEAGTLVGNTITWHCERLLQACVKMSSTLTTYGEERDDPLLSRSLGRISKDRESVWDGTGCLEKAGEQWQSAYQKSFNVAEPMLWKLVNWITQQTERMLGILHIQIPEMIKTPSPQIVLLSWIMLAFSLAIFQGRSSGQGRKVVILLCSALGAVVLGLIEGSSSTSIVLTNIPWCLTFGILVDAAVNFASCRLQRRATYTGIYTSEQVEEKQMENTV